jgi:hypothetical protein
MTGETNKRDGKGIWEKGVKGAKEGRRRIRDEDMIEMAFPNRLNLYKH